MVIIFEAHTADTPAGRPEAVPIPIAPVVLNVMAVKVMFAHNVGFDEAAPTVLAGVTVIVPVALIAPQPPVNGIL